MKAYIILVNISLVVFYLIYHLLLRKLTFFQVNRIYLLSAVILSFSLPAIQFIDLSSLEYNAILMPVVTMGQSELRIPEIVISPNQNFWKWNWNFELIYWISIGIATLYLFLRLVKLHQRFNQKNGRSSFSFLNFIYLGEEAKSNSIIRRHELVHVAQGHSYDILFLEITRIFNWFNPVFYFYLKALKFQHECIADQQCAKEDKASYAELLIANALRVPTNMLSHEFASESILKKRIMMLFKNKSKKSSQWQYALIVPIASIIACVGLVLNNSVLAKTDFINEVMQTELPIIAEAANSLVTIEQQEDQQEKIYDQPEVLPEPIGGMKAFMQQIGQQFKYSEEMILHAVQGTIEVKFIVEKDGSITHVKAKNDLGHGAAMAAENVVKTSKKWKPGIHNGKSVRVAFLLPIKIEVGQYPEPVVSKIVAEEQTPARITLKGSPSNQSNTTDGSDDTEFQGASVSKGEFRGNPNQDSVIFTAVEVLPSPPDGMRAFMIYIGENYDYPDEALKNGINGVIEVSFIVEKDGSLSNFKVKKDLKYGTGEAAINVIKNYPKKWRPGIQNGHNVRVAYTMPIRLNTINQ